MIFIQDSTISEWFFSAWLVCLGIRSRLQVQDGHFQSLSLWERRLYADALAGTDFSTAPGWLDDRKLVESLAPKARSLRNAGHARRPPFLDMYVYLGAVNR